MLIMLLLLKFFFTIVKKFSSSSKTSNTKIGVPKILSIFSSVFENCQIVTSKPDCKLTMFIWDSGESFGVTQFRSDFIDYVKANIPVKDVTTVNRFIGIVTKINKFVDVNGNTCYLPRVSYHLTSTDVRIFSPQNYHQIHGGYFTIHGNHVMMHLKYHNISIPIDIKHSNVPVISYFL